MFDLISTLALYVALHIVLAAVNRGLASFHPWELSQPHDQASVLMLLSRILFWTQDHLWRKVAFHATCFLAQSCSTPRRYALAMPYQAYMRVGLLVEVE